MKIFLDDIRTCPEGWTLAKTAHEAIQLLAANKVEQISLDHDLGEDCNGNGNDVLVWIEEKVFLDPSYDPPAMKVHSANPVAQSKINMGIQAIHLKLGARK